MVKFRKHVANKPEIDDVRFVLHVSGSEVVSVESLSERRTVNHKESFLEGRKLF